MSPHLIAGLPSFVYFPSGIKLTGCLFPSTRVYHSAVQLYFDFERRDLTSPLTGRLFFTDTAVTRLQTRPPQSWKEQAGKKRVKMPRSPPLVPRFSCFAWTTAAWVAANLQLISRVLKKFYFLPEFSLFLWRGKFSEALNTPEVLLLIEILVFRQSCYESPLTWSAQALKIRTRSHHSFTRILSWFLLGLLFLWYTVVGGEQKPPSLRSW